MKTAEKKKINDKILIKKNEKKNVIS